MISNLVPSSSFFVLADETSIGAGLSDGIENRCNDDGLVDFGCTGIVVREIDLDKMAVSTIARMILGRFSSSTDHIKWAGCETMW